MAHTNVHGMIQGIGALYDVFNPTGINLPGQAAVGSLAAGTGLPPGGGVMAPGQTFRIDRHGNVVSCRRRRRRRLLTEQDYNDLMRLGTLPNKENVKIGIAKAIGRSR